MAFVFMTVLGILAVPTAQQTFARACSYYDQYGDHAWIQSDFSYPTCTQNGYYDITCTVCGITERHYTPAYGHSWERENGGNPSTCTEQGNKFYRCTECGETYVEYFPAMGHDWVLISFAYPTCEADGWEKYRCSRCGEESTTTTPATGHAWYDTGMGVPSTCITQGYEIWHCNGCGQDKQETLPFGSHNWVPTGNSIEATCLKEGWVEEKCTYCGGVQAYTTPKADHVYGAWTESTPPTDHSQGVRTSSCVNCGDTLYDYYYPDGTYYRGGETGSAVADIQQKLIDLGYLNDVADGIFGALTEAAVKGFQSANGLTADGIAWPQTVNAINAKWQEQKDGKPSPADPESGAGGDGGKKSAQPPVQNTPLVQTPEQNTGGAQAPETPAGEGKESISFDESVDGLLQKENELREKLKTQAGDSELTELSELSRQWEQKLDTVYTEWIQTFSETDRQDIEKIKETFYNSLSLRERMITASGRTGVQAKLWKLNELKSQYARLTEQLSGEAVG